MSKRRTYPAYLSREEHEREEERVRRMVEGITGIGVSQERAVLSKPVQRVKRGEADGSHRPKASFRTRLNATDTLELTIWSGKKDPEAEVIVAVIQRNEDGQWRNISRIAVYRSPDGTLNQLPERER